MKKVSSVIIGAFLAGAVLPVDLGAAGYRWLDKSPASYFTDEEWQLLQVTARKALDEGEVGETSHWRNDEGGASGTITVLENSEHEGLPCRNLEFFNNAGGVTGGGVFRLCRIADGTWKLTP